MIKSMILKVVGRNQPEVRTNVLKQNITFRTIQPSEKLDFETWMEELNVSSSFTLLEDSDWLTKVRKNEKLFTKTWNPKESFVY
jgi:hypothetical protein